jgi:hypothetical protein
MMSVADIAMRAVSAESVHGQCPFHSLSPEVFDEWLERGLQCSAGKREFKLGRYFVARFRNGGDFSEALEQFRREVAEYKKTGFLCLFIHDEARCKRAEDELWLLGEAMREAGVADDAASVIDGGTVAIPIEVNCPVTGEPTIYEFFSVAFCRHAANPRDKLYDPSLSAPFTAVNTTSDAFAFATLVRDQSIRAWGCPPHELTNRDDVEMLFRKCVTVWQNMSINTIQGYSRIAVDPSRGVHLSEDRRRWIAAHNDPVFAELEKCPHFHEMPITYATRLCEKWSATMFHGEAYVPSRDGQAGGVPVFSVEGVPDELYQF